jgi:hypothetical protein
MALTDDLISFWELNEASGARVDAHGDNDLTDNNTVTAVAGVVGDAAEFELSNGEYLSHASNASLQMGNIDFTITGWFQIESNATTQKAVSKDDGFVEEYAIDCTIGGNFRFLAGYGTSATHNADLGGAASLATWYFIVGWHDAAADTVNICADNGTPVSASTGGDAIVTGTTDFTLGRRSEAGLPFYFDGLMDQVGIWKRKLTSDEITYLYNGGNGRSYADFAVRRFLLARP